MSHDEALDTNSSSNPSLAEIVDNRLENPSRRGLFRGAAFTAALGFLGTSVGAPTGTAKAQTPTAAARRPASLGFKSVPKSLADTVTVPEGYRVKVMFRLGDPMVANVP